MKKHVFSLLLVLVVFLVGCQVNQDSKVEDVEPTYEPITTRHLDIYFDKFSENKVACDVHGQAIKDRLEGYAIKAHGFIRDVITDLEYDFQHDGDYLDVRLTCSYRIHVTYRNGMYAYGATEQQAYDGGVFRLKKYYHPETKRLTALEFVED